ncbi:MAG TPA: LamG-like jellyroll fold domain-containing protein [Methylomirabilota bacterium]|nr:LamG-like jellyroll fold domain-containing protein [Methylomirabilota bacterium]
MTFDRTGQLSWRSQTNVGITVLERSTHGTQGPWTPLFYHFATNEPFTVILTSLNRPASFYRIRQQIDPPDTNLILHLTFDNDFEPGVVLDSSGYGNHGLRYGRPCCPTNWPTTTQGPDGSQAALFRWYADGYGRYGRSGDYIGIPNKPIFENLTNFTVTAWARFFAAYDGNYQSDHNSTIFNSGNAVPGVWFLGRNFSDYMSFTVYTNTTDSIRILSFPDRSTPDGDTFRWNHYAVTFDRGEVRGFFNGLCFRTNFIPVQALTSAGYYTGIGVWTFNRTPAMDLDEDLHPNNGWINGTLDDLRIYRRTLANEEIESLFYSYDRDLPTVPTNLQARAASSNIVELRWNASVDNFRVAGYTIRRDGIVIGTTPGQMYLDQGLTPGASYTYTVEAFDYANHVSGPGAPLHYTAPATAGTIELIVDNEDGAPWITYVGTWNKDANWIPGAFLNAWRNDGGTDKGLKTATFRPVLPADGQYQVWIRYVQRGSFAGNVPVDVLYDGGQHTATINQRTGGGTWQSLGTFSFLAGTNGAVRIRTDGTTGNVIADAVRFTR